jgi:hypothetical protein
MSAVLTLRQLNRGTLARQHLLERVAMPAHDLIEQLVGLQAQEPRDPYVGLWSRLVDFDITELETLPSTAASSGSRCNAGRSMS